MQAKRPISCFDKVNKTFDFANENFNNLHVLHTEDCPPKMNKRNK